MYKPHFRSLLAVGQLREAQFSARKRVYFHRVSKPSGPQYEDSVPCKYVDCSHSLTHSKRNLLLLNMTGPVQCGLWSAHQTPAYPSFNKRPSPFQIHHGEIVCASPPNPALLRRSSRVQGGTCYVFFVACDLFAMPKLAVWNGVEQCGCGEIGYGYCDHHMHFPQLLLLEWNVALSVIPRGPRALVHPPSQPSGSALTNILAEAAEKLYPRLLLYKALVGFKNDPDRRQPSEDLICEDRRNFLDAFATICDVEKGGATVTACSLQKLKYSNFLWLAANEGIRNDVKTYAEELLQALQAAQLETEKFIKKKKIFALAVDRCRLRINFYKAQMQRYARNCRMQLRHGVLDDNARLLRSKLKKLSEPSPGLTLASLVDHCYSLRGPFVEQLQAKSTATKDEFSELAHYIGRMRFVRSSAISLVRGMIHVPALRRITQIRTIIAPELQYVSITEQSPYEIVRAILKDSTSQNPNDARAALHAIVDYDIPGDDSIRETVSSHTRLPARVHAELQIADHFSRDKLEFVDNDKYIGCSKPACYFCYSWLSSHHHIYVPPATHHKVIPKCRGPDSDINGAGAKFLAEMYKKMCRRLDQDILGFLLDQESRSAQPGRQYMSTEGSSLASGYVVRGFH
ncbi:hypothetical protein BKA66DRAFT_444226 [Pyrenochaeta sp. MPI-SDFR-AT-0127]|nr:hypothetical protein BKA66DRAFT_444226 [Pyrenochaeta sp. MPI-SDFR-AT-0127]